MSGVLCTCVLIGHILASEISIIILSSEIFEIHFDDTIILLYSTMHYILYMNFIKNVTIHEKKRQDSPKSLSNY